jgi:hypothetical protein
MHTKIVAKIHCPCYMAFLAKNALQVLPENIFYCGVKAHNSSAMKATNSSLLKNQVGMQMDPMGQTQSLILFLFHYAGGQLRVTILSIKA